MKLISKKSILWISLGYIASFILLLLISELCNKNWCDIQEDGLLISILYLFFPLAPIFIFSLITYRMHNSVFRAWRNFAVWFVPIILMATLFLQTRKGGGGGWGISSGMDEFIILGLLYIIYIATSIIKIVRTYFRGRFTKQKIAGDELKTAIKETDIIIMMVAVFLLVFLLVLSL